MSDTYKLAISERDAVLRERDAFVRGISSTVRGCSTISHAQTQRATIYTRDVTLTPDVGLSDNEQALAWARQLYPLPQVVRERVLADPHEIGIRWRVRPGEFDHSALVLEVYDMGWRPLYSDPARFPVSADRAKLWADLYCRPTELVDE